MSEKFKTGDRVRVIRKIDKMAVFGLCGTVADTAGLDRTTRPVSVTFDNNQGNYWFKDNELQHESDTPIKERQAKRSKIWYTDEPDVIGPLPIGQTRPPSCCLVL